ncbi:uncharacterized protein LOC131884812 isoform X2 [Tigriopus californicus]|uniref:uncharacterized protein LOC131884812 isoform X2 n=1 Tax=Tigriopus californicus TaxID=6832 RepID=UPI0027DA8954|nr:uncharacterized protein LOC131884812 isoform X2 [Tigriopus californicus]
MSCSVNRYRRNTSFASWFANLTKMAPKFSIIFSWFVLATLVSGTPNFPTSSQSHLDNQFAAKLEAVHARDDDLDYDQEVVMSLDSDDDQTPPQLTINPETLPVGWDCMDKVMMIDDIEYTDEIQCTHIAEESCHNTYETVFKATQIEECKEKFKKDCYIEYKTVPRTEKIEICQEPLIRDCEAQGENVCSNEYESVCETTYHENEVEDDIPQCESIKEEICNANSKCTKVAKQVCNLMKMSSTKLTPETECRQEVREVCGPELCPISKGPKVCANELKTFVQEVPEERCNLTPIKVCNPVSKIVPRLELKMECIDVPREICSTVPVEAKKIQRPVIKKWCGPVSNHNNSRKKSPSNNA